MKVIVDIASLACSKRGAITGALYCDLGGTYFPDKQWNDFVVIVLGWWIRALVSVAQDEAIFRFMDGPYWIKLTPLSTDLASVVSWEAGDNNGAIHSGSATCEEIGAQLALAAEKVLEVCGKKQWKGDDVEVLLRGLGELRHLLGNIRKIGSGASPPNVH